MKYIIYLSIILWFCYCNNNDNPITPPIPEQKSKTTNAIKAPSPEAQRDLIDSALKENKNSSSLWTKKAQFYLLSKKTDSAILCYEKAIKINNKNIDAKLALSYLLAENKNDKVLKICDELLALKKNLITSKAFYIKGLYYSSISDMDNAIINFDNCIKNDWTFLDAHLEKGILLLKNKKPQYALNVFKIAIKINNKNAETYYWLGRAFEALENKQSAINLYKQSLLLDPNFDVAKQRLRTVLEKK